MQFTVTITDKRYCYRYKGTPLKIFRTKQLDLYKFQHMARRLYLSCYSVPVWLFVILHTFAFGRQNLRNKTLVNKTTPSIALKTHNHNIYTRRFESYGQVIAFETSCTFSAVSVFLRRWEESFYWLVMCYKLLHCHAIPWRRTYCVYFMCCSDNGALQCRTALCHSLHSMSLDVNLLAIRNHPCCTGHTAWSDVWLTCVWLNKCSPQEEVLWTKIVDLNSIYILYYRPIVDFLQW